MMKVYSRTAISGGQKPILWIGSSLNDLKDFPDDVKRLMGQALNDAQHGGKHPRAKPLRGFSGASVLEVVDDFEGNTFRTVYTVKFSGFVYVLHAFQKKSKRGNETPAKEIVLIKQRLKTAEVHAKENRV